jgi:hypothetical protein
MHGKVWVLDTETKGTGAQMVPLESTLKQPQPKEHFLPATARRHKPAPEPVERAHGASGSPTSSAARRSATTSTHEPRSRLLAEQRSSVDVNVSVWEPGEDRWRLLTLAEKQLLWERRRVRLTAARAASAARVSASRSRSWMSPGSPSASIAASWSRSRKQVATGSVSRR